MAKKNIKCTFCGRPADMSEMLIPSAVSDAYICCECIDSIHDMLGQYREDEKADRKNKAAVSLDDVPKPRQIHEFLNQYVIGQEDAKKYLSVAVYNHYKTSVTKAGRRC